MDGFSIYIYIMGIWGKTCATEHARDPEASRRAYPSATKAAAARNHWKRRRHEKGEDSDLTLSCVMLTNEPSISSLKSAFPPANLVTFHPKNLSLVAIVLGQAGRKNGDSGRQSPSSNICYLVNSC